MHEKDLANLRGRTDAKLVYAQVHLDFLRCHGGNAGSDVDRALQESFLFHLLGAKDAFLAELNAYYGLKLSAADVTPGNLRDKLKSQGRTSQELAELYALEGDEGSWLSHAKQMRDHCTHVAGVPRAFHIGGPDDGKVFLRNPKTGTHVEHDAPDALHAWLANMRQLLERLRSMALAANAS